MAFIVSRSNRFYVVAYDGIDPLTGRERRRWHSAGSFRADADAIANTLTTINSQCRDRVAQAITVGEYLSATWMPRCRQQLRPSTTVAARSATDRIDSREPSGPRHRRIHRLVE